LLAQSRLRLVELQHELDEIENVSSEIEGALSRFLVVRASGHVEFTFDETFSVFAKSKSSPAIGSFVRAQFFKGRNPTPVRIADGLRQLDPAKSDKFVAFIDENDQARRRELEFMVNRRNKIAHGQSEGIGRNKALALADVAMQIGDWITTELDPR
jgi:hypothetical protein